MDLSVELAKIYLLILNTLKLFTCKRYLQLFSIHMILSYYETGDYYYIVTG